MNKMINGIKNLFSRRQKSIQDESSEIQEYDILPETLKKQILLILKEAIGHVNEKRGIYNYERDKDIIITVLSALREEYGELNLLSSTKIPQSELYNPDDPSDEYCYFFLYSKDTMKLIDFIELSFSELQKHDDDDLLKEAGIVCKSPFSWSEHDLIEVSIDKLNTRFADHKVGYQFENGQIILVNSQFIHTEVVKPALQVLSNPVFRGAQDEFLKAHEHYRHGRHKEALSECLKSFESTMKIICDLKGWTYNSDKSTSKNLIDICFANELIPKYWSEHFTSIRVMLVAGVPMVRNRQGGHGQGAVVVEVPAHIVAYALHMTAATIVFLVEAYEQIK
jgi:AbiJ N-terminal domain 4